MKKLALLLGFLLTTLAGHAQTVNVHKTNGEVVSFPLTEVSYVDVLEGDDTVGPPEGVEAVDLGLPSGTKWANMNVGATKPEEYGGYYAWGETEEKGYYGPDNYARPVRHGPLYEEGFWPINNIAFTQYDVASVRWGGMWHMPTREQNNELYQNCNSKWTEVNGVYGYKFTSKINNKSIFLPAAGYREYNVVRNIKKELRYATEGYNTFLEKTDPSITVSWESYSEPNGVSHGSGRGYSVRPVCDE